MNTSERIVEAYYRLVKRYFTVTDVKVIGGKGRQIDLLALSLRDTLTYHIETSVSHEEAWIPSLEKLTPIIKFKFMGYPRERPNGGPNTDFARGINYFENIRNTYRAYGVNVRRVRRVICVWGVRANEQEELQYLHHQEDEFGLPRGNLSILRFRDVVIPGLRDAVGRSNYDDDALRMFSLLKQYELQTQNQGA